MLKCSTSYDKNVIYTIICVLFTYFFVLFFYLSIFLPLTFVELCFLGIIINYLSPILSFQKDRPFSYACMDFTTVT